MNVERIEVGSEAFEGFLKLPWQVNSGDPRWIPSDPAYEASQLAESHPFRRYGSVQIFGARQQGELVARCVAMLNPRIDAAELPVGLVGFFESQDDYEATEAVLGAAVDWLQGLGAKAIWGPMEFSIWHSYRFMTQGFDTIPFLGEPYNPRYYPAFFERFGFAPSQRWRSWDLALPHLKGMMAAANALPRDKIDQAGFTAKKIAAEDWNDALPRVHALLMQSFRGNFGFAPIDLDEFESLCAPLAALISPGATPVLAFDPAGEPCGYAYVYLDLGPQVREQAGLPRADLRGMSTPYKGKRVVLHTVAVAERYRGQGLVNALLGVESSRDFMQSGITSAVGAVAKDGRTVYDKIGAHSREYHLYALNPR